MKQQKYINYLVMEGSLQDMASWFMTSTSAHISDYSPALCAVVHIQGDTRCKDSKIHQLFAEKYSFIFQHISILS